MKNTFRQKQNHRLSFDSLEARRLLAADITFSEPDIFRAGVSPDEITVGDWNGDDILDLAVANFGRRPPAGDVSVLMGRGDGTFDRQVRYQANNKPVDITNYDVNRDGHPDLIVPNVDSRDVSVLLNQGDGTFVKQADYPGRGIGVGNVAVADMNDDGIADIVTAVWSRRGAGVPGELVILPGTEEGTFGAPEDLVSPAGWPGVGLVDDLDGDGDTDLVVRAVRRPTSNLLRVHLRASDGSFDAPIELTGLQGATGLALGDLNNDGRLDLIVANSERHNVAVFFAKAEGGYEDVAMFPAGRSPGSIAVNDFDLDGDLDLAVANSNSQFNLLVNDGTGQFADPERTRILGSPQYITSADLNGDMLPDLAISSDRGVSILLNQTQVAPQRAPGDVNGDGIFNSTDLIAVFQAGEYEDGIEDNSTFEEGDWDGDGDFTSSDLVVAFREGNYVTAASRADATDSIFTWSDLMAAFREGNHGTAVRQTDATDSALGTPFDNDQTQVAIRHM